MPYVLSMELDPLPVTQSTALFSLTHTFRKVCHRRKGRVPREELGTWGPDGVLATVLRQGERVPAGVTHVLSLIHISEPTRH